MKRGLARGLASLLSQDTISDQKVFGPLNLDVSRITVLEQTRKNFDEEALAELAESIKHHGILQPLLVVSEGSDFRLVSGERRLRAAKMLGLKEVPVIVLENKTDRDKVLIQLIENLQRVDLSPIEEARAYQKLIETHALSHEQIASSVGKSRAHVTNMLRLLALDSSVLEMVNKGVISVGHAKVLASLSSVAQRSLAKKVVTENLSVRALEERVKELAAIEKGVLLKRNTVKIDPVLQETLGKISNKLGLRVSLSGLTLKIKLKRLSDLDTILKFFQV
ncbi:MAG: ParB/RepB/Spo0J family partition protein [Deltaproteobacteria bacterium]|nr:ParB/RepB/Spo0J family partition protein [Deltaproteobacteria bacterium]MCX7952193.1 ParB/RepB/Spo0J family partition protein [Deltaproteobacteria bacterium]